MIAGAKQVFRLSAAGLVATIVALMAPAWASAEDQHLLKQYKVERHLDLNAGQSIDEHVSCEPGDYALDGMWRVDSVDQDQTPPLTDDLRSVHFRASYGDGDNPGKWHFDVTNEAGGRAQLKLFLTCLGSQTEPNDHRHGIGIGPRLSSPASHAGGIAGFNHATTCASGQIAVAPGFKTTSGRVRIRGQYPSGPEVRRWFWEFDFEGAGSVDLRQRCLGLYTGRYAGHYHKIKRSFRPAFYPGGERLIPPSSVKEEEVSCDDLAKGMMGAWYIKPGDHPHGWYLGMDPRLKTRAFKFQNTSTTDNPQ